MTLDSFLLRLRHSRIAHGLIANGVGQGVTVFVQLVTIPLLIGAWGLHTYGLWIVLSATLAYISMTDLGFGVVAANSMTMDIARGKPASARVTHQTLLLILTVCGAAVALVVTAVVLLLPQQIWPKGFDPTEIRLSLLCLTVSAIFTLGWIGVSSGLRADGKYGLGIFISDMTRLTEAISVVAIAWSGGGVLMAACACVLVRASGLVIGFVVLRLLAPWVRLGFAEASLQQIRSLAPAAMAAVAVPVGLVLSIQGMTLEVSQVLGLGTVAVFTTTRTLTRMVVQMVLIPSNAFMPEVSRAIGAEDRPRYRVLLRRNLAVTAVIIVIFSGVVLIAGPFLVRTMTTHRGAADRLLLALMCGAAALQALWTSSAGMLLAANRPSAYAYWYASLAALALVVGYPLARAWGLEGAATAMILADASMVAVVMSQLRDFTRRFEAAAAVVPT